ncbi:MAG: sorting protein [Chthoniobacteraceae bacterium]|nr:sorting protein [Chthoniobacteraceae bacterium]
MPNIPDSRHAKLLSVIITGIALCKIICPPIQAAVLYPDANSLVVTIPAGTNNGTRDGKSAANAFVDDAYLNTIKFTGTTGPTNTYSAGTSASFTNNAFRPVTVARVTANNANVNAEFGDLDNGSDGNPNPFVSAKLVAEGFNLTSDPNPTRESVDPAIQNPAIAASLNSLSLVQGVDGESDYTMNLFFGSGVNDSNPAVDSAPELLVFERGVNSDFTVRAIIGGTIAVPLFAPNTVTFTRNAAANTGFYIDTIEITGGQQLGAYGVDLNDFFTGAPSTVYGVQIASITGSGSDLYGTFLSAINPNQFVAPLSGAEPVPEGSALPAALGVAGLAMMDALRRFRGAKKQ